MAGGYGQNQKTRLLKSTKCVTDIILHVDLEGVEVGQKFLAR